MLANMSCHNLAMLRRRVRQDVLDQIVTILVAGNVNQGNPRSVDTPLAHTVKVSTKEFRTADLQALLDHLGGELIHAVLGSVADDMVNGAAAVGWSAMLADVLDAPVTELAVSNDVDIGQYLFDAGTLSGCVSDVSIQGRKKGI